jgi:putative acetyltransferase
MLKTSLKAHNFIPEQYWIDNKSLMAEKYLPNSEVYVAEKADNICGFVAIVESLYCINFCRQ